MNYFNLWALRDLKSRRFKNAAVQLRFLPLIGLRERKIHININKFGDSPGFMCVCVLGLIPINKVPPNPRTTP